MANKMSLQYYIFRKKLILIKFYRKKDMSYEDIAFIVESHAEIVKTYCITLLHEA